MTKRNIASLSLLLASLVLITGAWQTSSGSSPAGLSPEVAHRVQTEIRSRYGVPSQVNISLSEPRSSQIPDYEEITVTFSGGTRNSTHEFLISKDRKTLARLEKVDISQDLMSKIEMKGRPVRGNENAKVTIVNFDDFQCPFCSKMHSTLFPGLLQQYGASIKVVYKDYPLVEIHPWAMHAAVDANCLAAQNNDAYWDFADYVHGNQREIAGHSRDEAFGNLDKLAAQQAAKHHLDSQKVDACVKKQDDSAIKASVSEGDQIGVDSTPTLFVNGERISGALPPDEVRAIIDRALADAGQPTPGADVKK